MLTQESVIWEIRHLPEQLQKRIERQSLTVSVAPSSKIPDSLCLRLNGPTIDQCEIEIGSDTLAMEIPGWIVPQMVLAVEVFAAERESAYTQMEFGC